MSKARLILLYISLYIIALFIVPSYSQRPMGDPNGPLLGNDVVVVMRYANDANM